MSNGKKNNRDQGRGRQPKATTTPARTSADDIKDAHDRAFASATESDLDKVAERPAPKGADTAALWRRVDEAEQLFKAAAARLEEEQAGVATKAAELDRWEQGIAARAEDVAGRESRIAEREKDLADKEKAAAKVFREADALQKDLNQREEAVRAMEAEAEAGFAERNREATRRLAEQVAALADEHDALQRRMAEASTNQVEASAEVWDTARREAEAAIAAEREKLIEERTGLVALKSKAVRARQEVEWEKEELRGERELLRVRAEQLAAREIAEKEGQITALTARLAEATRQRDELDTSVREHEGRARRFGHRTDAEVEALLAGLEGRVSELTAELARRPSNASVDEANALRAERDGLATDLSCTRHELEALRVQLTRTEVGVSELEALRDQCHSFKKSNELLHAANEQLRRDIDARIRSSDGSSPFPACTAIDVDGKLQGRRPVSDEVDLQELVSRARDGAASAETPLYYTPEDLRAFLGGMAMSRLALLQGPSGTGKTSLPFAFARALGTVVELVPAEAGWHDPADLLGHFNQFERRFDERPFLQALYRAGTPYYADVPVFIVVDEMNLSHPEQYFSNVISMLEAERHGNQLFELLPIAASGAPSQLVDGRSLRMPGNVWFVGTANHDETTKDFADKTYDRAVVMELPLKPAPFNTEPPFALDLPIGLEALEEAFQRAARRHEKETSMALQFLDTHLKDPLARRFRTGWSPRLDRQARRFVPAVIAAGGSMAEALDHLAAMRILRKIRDRHATRMDDLDVLCEVFEARWKADIDKKRRPTRCLELLDAEAHRIERDLS